MTTPTHPRPLTRAFNAVVAAAFGALVLAVYWPMVRLLDLSLADLEYQGVWIGSHAKQITEVTPNGVADRSGLHVGDILEFDPGKEADWVLASYREMPEGFSATLPVRHADGSRTLISLVPERVAYLPTLNDRMSLLARLSALTIGILLGVFVVWARPSLMAWSLLLVMVAYAPWRPLITYYFAFEAGHGFGFVPALVFTPSLVVANVPFALCFPRNALAGWSWWKRALGLLVVLAWLSFLARLLNFAPFERDGPLTAELRIAAAFAILFCLVAMAVLWRTYRNSDGSDRARVKWAMLGVSAAVSAFGFAALLASLTFWTSNSVSGSSGVPTHWVVALSTGILWPLAIGYAILRQRVVDVQFAVSRTLTYGAVSTLALACVGGVHWLLGRLIEQSHLTIGLEGLAAIGVGLAMNRTTHGINRLLDRVLFRKHHQAEQRLRRVTIALPYATDERSIAEAVVAEPVRQLKLASAALFYRSSSGGPLRRVLAHGWSDEHATTLDADAMLVRYLQAEHETLKLDDPDLLPAGVPDGAALPVLAIPLVNQHQVTAVVLYGSHVNSTLLDPDEVKLLEALAKAAATSHQQVRIAMLTRENEAQKARNDQLESSTAELRALVHESIGSPSGISANRKPA